MTGVQTCALPISTNLIASFKTRYPDTTFSLDVTNRETLLKQLENNESDLVIMGRPPREMALTTEAFMENPLVIIASPEHPLLKYKNISLDQLQEETFVVREQGSGTRIAMERYFFEKGVRLRTGMEMNSNEAIKQSVEAGLGLGIVSIHTLALELEVNRIAILHVEGFPILRHWYVVHRRGKRLSPVADSFKAFVLQESRNILQLPKM